MIPYSYGNIHSSVSVYIPIFIALFILFGVAVAYLKFKDKLAALATAPRIGVIVGTFAVIGCICTLCLTIPYKQMSLGNENAKYTVLSTTEITNCDIDKQTVTYEKDGKEVTENTLITVTYDNPRLEVRRYSWCGMYRDYNVTLILSPDAIKVVEE